MNPQKTWQELRIQLAENARLRAENAQLRGRNKKLARSRDRWRDKYRELWRNWRAWGSR
jgi:hypothetical protein